MELTLMLSADGKLPPHKSSNEYYLQNAGSKLKTAILQTRPMCRGEFLAQQLV